ncbi:MAG: GNAT family N-acetyltransferase [Candidatus Hodarchaeota archaeon]
MDEYIFSVHKRKIEATKENLMVIYEGLGNNILKQLGQVELGKPIRIFIKSKKDEVVGGISASVFGNYVYIELLWIEESLRNKGYGTKLLNMIETEAKELGCKYAHADTYSFEARPFYEKNGYTLFGTLDDYIEGHSKYFLRKNLEDLNSEIKKRVF